MNDRNKAIDVYADWIGLEVPTQLGTLFAHESRGKEVFSFEYDAVWLREDDNRAMDPELGQFKGPQYAAVEKPNFGLFMGSSPDRWGRLLMRRREAILARKEAREMRNLRESDFLLGVHDKNRLGALRFRERGKTLFQNSSDSVEAPPWAQLRKLEYASFLAEYEEDDEKVDPWLAMLIAPGSSLGGTRPKTCVVDSRGEMWLAKFPGKDDDWDAGAWEMLTAELAQEVGVESTTCILET